MLWLVVLSCAVIDGAFQSPNENLGQYYEAEARMDRHIFQNPEIDFCNLDGPQGKDGQ